MFLKNSFAFLIIIICIINVAKIPTKIPVIKLVAIVVNKVIKKIISCSFPTLNTLTIFSGDANL